MHGYHKDAHITTLLLNGYCIPSKRYITGYSTIITEKHYAAEYESTLLSEWQQSFAAMDPNPQ